MTFRGLSLVSKDSVTGKGGGGSDKFTGSGSRGAQHGDFAYYFSSKRHWTCLSICSVAL